MFTKEIYGVFSCIAYKCSELLYMNRNKTSSSAIAERPRNAWLSSLSINVQLYSQNYKIAFLSPPMGA